MVNTYICISNIVTFSVMLDSVPAFMSLNSPSEQRGVPLGVPRGGKRHSRWQSASRDLGGVVGQEFEPGLQWGR